MIGLLLIDDHQILLDGVMEFLSRDEKLRVERTAATGKEALEILEFHHDKIHVVVSDIGLPDMKGTILAGAIKQKYSDIKVIMLSMHEERHIINEAIKNGVDGYVLKKSTSEDLILAIHTVSNGEKYVSPTVTELLMDYVKNPSIVESLSERELEIISLICQEFTSKKIAEKLFISEKTIEAHKTNIFRKTNTSTLVGLTKFALSHNLSN